MNNKYKQYVAVMICLMLGLSYLFSISSADNSIGARKNIELTVYNQDFALVKEQRELTLKKGVNELLLEEVAAQIDPTSVHFKSLTDPVGTYIVEQNYDYDLVNTTKLMEKYIGKGIKLERILDNKKETVDATLLSTGQAKYPKNMQQNYGYGNFYYNTGGTVMKIDDQIYINPGGTVILPELTEGLILKPTLDWTVTAKKEGTHQTELSYITNGINWDADYVVVTDKDDKTLDLTGWVTLDNRSGVTYNNAKLKLMAGDIHLVKPAQMEMVQQRMAFYGAMDDLSGREPQFQEKGFYEYHLYTLQRPATIKDSQTKQIEFTSSANVPFKKLYVYDGLQTDNRWQGYDPYSLRELPEYGTQSNKKVFVMLEFMNSEKNNLGMPLPKGKVRVYKSDTDGSQEFIGEDQIDHTPKDEKIRVYTGNAFDIVGERKQTNFKKIADRVIEESFEIKVRNHKKEDIDVRVVEHLYRWNEWELVQKSMDFEKKDAQTIEFLTHIPKDGESVITYTVRYTW
jgi:hypothetical protein